MQWKNVLVAFDNSPSALRAVEYVGEMFRGIDEIQVTLYSIYERIPDADVMLETHFTSQVKERIHALERERQADALRLEEARGKLCQMGFSDTQVRALYVEKKKNIATQIMDEVKAGDYGTVVVGRRGVSNLKHFIYGSVASSIVSNLTGATICVVE